MSHKITFRERGQGPTLLLLHGYGGSVHHWEACATELAKNYHVVIPNLSHLFMSTDRIFFSIQVEALADFIRRHFPEQKVHIAGLSFGGALSWALRLQHPQLVDKLILINPMIVDPIPNFNLPELRYFFVMPLTSRAIYVLLSTQIGKAFLKRAAAIFRDERTEGVGRLEALKGRKLLFVSHLIYNFAWILRREDWQWWKQKMAATSFGSLLIFDREDLLFSKSVYLDFAKQLRCDKIIELTGSGHLAIKSRPETIALSIHEYLSTAKSAAVSA